MKKILLPVSALCAGVLLCLSLRGEAPSRLTTDLAEHTDRVWIGGYPSQVTLEQADKIVEPARFVTIGSRRPSFGWQVNDSRSDVMQTACRILLASSPGTLATDSADLWDSGVIPGDRSVAVPYAGKALEPGKIYYWKVMTFNNGDPQPWSAVKAFRTADSLTEYATPAYPLEKTDNGLPKTTQKLSDRLVFADFGYDAFGQLRLTLCSHAGGDTVTVRLGECLKDGRIDPAPGGSRRFLSQRLALLPGIRTYTVKIPADARNTGPQAVRMPDYIGEVYPFRYCEIEGDAIGNGTGIISRQVVNYPFDDLAAEFASSDTTLNQVWELCKYSIKATSFAGLYVDGDRERIPYEADALINQLSHYCVDREYTMARRSHEYLLGNATWPTEWILQSVLIAWYDYLYTGDLRAVKTHYETLKNKTLTALSGTDGFVSLTPEKLTPELYASINLRGQTLKNIVDWPHTGILGLGKAEGGETDGFVFRDVNTVVNAYHYCALELMARMAGAAGESEDSAAYARAAGRLADNFNKQLFNNRRLPRRHRHRPLLAARQHVPALLRTRRRKTDAGRCGFRQDAGHGLQRLRLAIPDGCAVRSRRSRLRAATAHVGCRTQLVQHDPRRLDHFAGSLGRQIQTEPGLEPRLGRGPGQHRPAQADGCRTDRTGFFAHRNPPAAGRTRKGLAADAHDTGRRGNGVRKHARPFHADDRRTGQRESRRLPAAARRNQKLRRDRQRAACRTDRPRRKFYKDRGSGFRKKRIYSEH